MTVSIWIMLVNEGSVLFYDKVGEIWKNENRGVNSSRKWQNKIRYTCQYLRGWAKNIGWNDKKQKMAISSMIDDLDKRQNSQLFPQVSKMHYVV